MKRFLFVLVGMLLVMLCSVAAIAVEEEKTPEGFIAEFMDAVVHGKPSLDVNLRWGNAKIDKRKSSNAITLRTRLGYGTKPLHGVSAFLEFKNVVSPKPSGYFDGTDGSNASKSIIADPEVIEANRFWLMLDRKDWLGSSLKVGRQRIKLDDDRWVGNVGWRQNEQTFDAVRLQSQLGHDRLLVQYIFAWENNRIFGDEGPANRRDFGMKAHFVNLSYRIAEALKVAAYVYLIDADDPFATTASSNTYGFRATGRTSMTESLDSVYEASWAYQTDAGDNTLDYGAHYYHLSAGLDLEAVGLIKFGYEVLGSDDGKAQILTPLATLHRFNGFADAFLNNGGPRGLRDVYVVLAPAIPIQKVELKFIFHQFHSDQGGDDLGQEYDLVTSYQYNEHLSFLYKVAYFDEGKSGAPESRLRNSVQTTFKF